MKKTPKKRVNRLVYQIFGITLLCVSILGMMFGFTYAWFMDESVTSTGAPNILVIGTVDLEVTTNFNFYNLVLAPDTDYTSGKIDGVDVSYATTLKTSEKNDVFSIYVRAKFSTNREELTMIFSDNLLDSDVVFNADTKASLIGNWYYNAEVDNNNDGVADSGDGYYYYIGSVGSSDITFNAGYHVDNTLNNDKAGDPVKIDFLFESIQRPYGAYKAEWTSAPAVFNNFALDDTGY